MNPPPFEAYVPETVVDRFPRKIECICTWHEQVLVGLQDGSLLFFKRVPDAADGQLKWQVRA